MSALKLMFITNDEDIAVIAEQAGVDRIFVDLEVMGKADRQGGRDTVLSDHTIEDVAKMKKVLSTAELLVRVNPIHDAGEGYTSSEEEINAVINSGADIIMLPYFKTLDEVKRFAEIVGGRVKTMLLVETPEAVGILDEILALGIIDEYHIGLNDLSIALGKKFMFELLCDGTVDGIVEKFKKAGVFYGFGGIASVGRGDVHAELIIVEHYRLGSRMAILSRSFCNVSKIKDHKLVKEVFEKGVKLIRYIESTIDENTDFDSNRAEIQKRVKEITDKL